MPPHGIAVFVAQWPWYSWSCGAPSCWAVLRRRTTLLYCSASENSAPFHWFRGHFQIGRARQWPTSPAAQTTKPADSANVLSLYGQNPKVDGTGSQPAFFSRPRDVENLSKPHHGCKEMSPWQSNNSISTVEQHRRCFFSHICKTLRSGTLSKRMRPINRALAFHRGFIPHSVPHHSPTPNARRPRLDGGFETKEPPHGPGDVSWFSSPFQGNTRSMASHVNKLAVRQGNGFFARPASTTISSSAGVLPTVIFKKCGCTPYDILAFFGPPFFTSTVLPLVTLYPLLGPNPLFFGFQAFVLSRTGPNFTPYDILAFFGSSLKQMRIYPLWNFGFFCPSLHPCWPSTMSITIPGTLNPKPWTLKPWTLNPKPKNLKPKNLKP